MTDHQDLTKWLRTRAEREDYFGHKLDAEKLDKLADLIDGQAAELERLRAELEACRVNDERYQWLRGRPWVCTAVVEQLPYPNNHILHQPVTRTIHITAAGSQLDAAIDAAMKEQQT
jgi:hypothetical protein